MIVLRRTFCAIVASLFLGATCLALEPPRELGKQTSAPVPLPSVVPDPAPVAENTATVEKTPTVMTATESTEKSLAKSATISQKVGSQQVGSQEVGKGPPAKFGTYYAPTDPPAVHGGCVPACGAAPQCGCENPCGAAPQCGCEKPCGCQAAPGCGCASSCGGRCCKERCERCPLHCAECDPWRLFPCGVGPCGRVKVGGWLAAGGSFADGGPPSNYNGPVTFNDRIKFQGNQAYAFIERAIENDGCGFDIGGRIDTLYGSDHRFTMARGLETTRTLGPKWNSGGSNLYGLALPQAYVEVAYDDVSVKLGHYYTIIGYEAVMAQANYFYSHSYTMQYGEPFTHTGALGSYQATDELTLYAGVDRGWDNWEDDNANESVMWGVAWDNGCGTAATVTGTWGKELSTIGTVRNGDRTLVSIVLSHEMSSRVTYALTGDIARQDDAGPSPTQAAEWYGITQYLFYKINCQWTAGLRMEWFRDDDGARVTGLGFGNPIAGSQFAGNFYEITFGLNYKPTSNLTFRPELRYDEYSGLRSPVGAALPYGDGIDTKQLSGAIDVIFTF